MILTDNFNKNIIIYAEGEFQIKLLLLIYFNLNQYFNQNFKYAGLEFDQQYKERIYKNIEGNLGLCNKENKKCSMLYIPNIKTSSNISIGSYTVFTKNKLTKYYKTKNLVHDNFLDDISRYISLKEYKLVNMKEFLQTHGKYLFVTKENYDYFMNRYSCLEKSPVFQSFKTINI